MALLSLLLGRRQPRLTTRPARRLGLEGLEERLAPAYNLTISTAATANVQQSNLFGDTVEFTASGTGANLNINDLRAALITGHVRVLPGPTGSEAGNISWSPGANLDINGMGSPRTLTLQTLLPGATGGITLNSSVVDSVSGGDRLALEVRAAGNVTASAADLSAVTGLTVTAGGVNGTASLGALNATGGPVAVIASTITLAGNISTGGQPITLDGNVVVTDHRELSTTAAGSAGGDITVTGTLNGTSLDRVTLGAGTGTVRLYSAVGSTGQIAGLAISAAATFLPSSVTLDSNNFAVGSLTVSGDLTFGGPTTINLVELADDSFVTFQGGDVTLNGNLNVQFGSLVSPFTVTDGTFQAGTHNVSTTGFLNLGDGTAPTTFRGAGTLSGNQIRFKNLTDVRPGGDAAGTLTLSALQTRFESGSRLTVNLGAATDRLQVGLLTISPDVTLDGVGTLASGAPVTLIQGTGLTGTFAGTSDGVPFVLAEDAVIPAYTSTQLRLTQVPADPDRIVRGVTPGGEIYTVRLTGRGGELVVVDDPTRFGVEGIVVRRSTAANVLSVALAANGGSPALSVESIRVQGALASIVAPAVVLTAASRLTGYLGALSIRDLSGGSILAGGTRLQATRVFGRRFNGDLTLGSRLASLSVAEYGSGTITTAGIGTLVTRGEPVSGIQGIFGASLTVDAGSSAALAVGAASIAGNLNNSTWDVRGRVGPVTVRGGTFNSTLGTVAEGAAYPGQLGGLASLVVGAAATQLGVNTTGRAGRLSAAEWLGLNLTAASVGTLQATGAAGFAGTMNGASVTVTGSFGLGRVGLGQLLVRGTVTSSTLTVTSGHVGLVSVGRFRSSRLYVGYTPAANLATRGTFTGAYRIGTFVTTAAPASPPAADPATAAFVSSEVVAARVGIVRLSSVLITTTGQRFGFRVDAVPFNVGSFRVATQPFNPLVNYRPSAGGAVSPAVSGQGDFAFFV